MPTTRRFWITRLADRLVAEAISSGGCTMMPMGAGQVWGPPRKGFVVGGLTQAARLPLDDEGLHLDGTGQALARAWVLVTIDEVKPGMGMGSWVDEGELWLDLVEVVQDQGVALAHAKERGERAVFDLAKGETIWVEGGEA